MQTGAIAEDGEPTERPETPASEIDEPAAPAADALQLSPPPVVEDEPPAMLPPADPLAALVASLDEPAAEAAEVVSPAPPAEAVPSTPVSEESAEASAGTEEAVVAGFATGRPRVTVWAFVAYDLVWLGLAGALVYYLLNLPPGTATYEASYYEPALWVAIGLLGLGVLLVPLVWLIARTQTAERTGLFSSVAFRGALAILVGALLWWGALAVVDYVRLGRVY